MCRFESSQNDENRAQSANSSKAYSKPRTFDGSSLVFTILAVWNFLLTGSNFLVASLINY